ncbi:helix-turn-helix domain-containing protein [Paenibacillus sp. NPDC058174]|uniref:AraC family transcriptional regulator n=1 Tax=Paenibacillus sp. NPDC058174 TaxID=3346366 RepID=UPI0036DE6B88
MEKIKLISDALLEIEAQLFNNSITPDSLANQFYTNTSDLQKTFQILTGVTIGEYIRNRRLSHAAITLKSKNISILEVALNTGYETPEAFSKAFKRFHGISPKDVRNRTLSRQVKYFGPMHIKFSVESSAPLTATEENHSMMSFVGRTLAISNDTSIYMQVIEQFWQQMNGALSELRNQYSAASFIGISLAGEGDQFIYGIGILTNEEVKDSNGFEVIQLPSGKWAKFAVNGITDEHFRHTRNRVLSEWMLISDHSISLLPEIEYYPITGTVSPEIWFPIIENHNKG